MMQLVKYPPRAEWKELLMRPSAGETEVLATVKNIISQVKTSGDLALRAYAEKFDGFVPDQFAVSDEEIKNACLQVPDALKTAIGEAAQNITRFHEKPGAEVRVVETMPGVSCWKKQLPIEKVGLYIPGGTAPLFSTVLMLGIPAKNAGCEQIILCTPAGRNGKIHPAILYAASVAGITEIYKTGGAQAIAAMAFGTESIPPVDKIFGPGNRYVTAAKLLVQGEGIAIDMPAGPSEICIVAGRSAEPSFIAADLLAQAEHGEDSQVLLLTDDEALAEATVKEVSRQLDLTPRKKIAARALSSSRVIVLRSLEEAMEMSNAYAPEHLLLMGEAEEMAAQVRHAGSVFIGSYSPEAVGDYASGTNHALPTYGYARSFSGVSTGSFMKWISFQQLTQEGLKNISTTVITMAEEEGLYAHGQAVRIRIDTIPCSQ